jgi:hypothetical protein
MRRHGSRRPAEVEASEPESAFSRDFKTWLLQVLVEALTGRRMDAPELETEAPAPPAAPPQIELRYERVRYEAERVDFRAHGVIRTADGRELALDLQVGMQREHYERVAVSTGKPKATDPLVLNFQAATTALGGRRVTFDLDLDGRADQLALPAAGSAFLALDRNRNGRIDDGSELFGPATGDGFSELAALDSDGDGWIDEDDAAFRELRVWNGGSELQTLAAAGVGAISVRAVATPFTLGRSDATAEGYVRSTGLWLGEDGSAHTVQHVDLVV